MNSKAESGAGISIKAPKGGFLRERKIQVKDHRWSGGGNKNKKGKGKQKKKRKKLK